MKNDTFKANIPTQAEILNVLYQNIWNDASLNETEKWKENNQLEAAVKDYHQGGYTLYKYYDDYMTKTKVVIHLPQENDFLHYFTG